MEGLSNFFNYVDQNREKYIQNLAEAVAIPSISAFPKYRDEVVKMAHYIKERLEGIGASVELAEIGKEKLPDGTAIDLPPVVLAHFNGIDPSKKSLLVYCHFDVQPASKSDGWNSDPFVLQEKDGKLFGRGATDDKGPLMGWIHTVEAFLNLGITFPVNLKFCFEGMEESKSTGLRELLVSRKDTYFFKDIDYIVISDVFWLGNEKPCLTYGLRGLCYFFIEVECASRDLQSVFGGTVHEAMADLVAMMNTLVDGRGNILIDGIMESVAPLTPEEEKLYNQIEFDMEAFQKDIGTSKLIHGHNKEKTLMARWRYPSLSLHGIEGAFSEPGAKTVIPAKVCGKFSIRLVPNQTPDEVKRKVKDYLNRKWQERGSSNKFRIIEDKGAFPWVSNLDSLVIEAGRKATKLVYGQEPDMIRLGGSIPITLDFEEVLGTKEILLFPMGCCDDGAHSQNEKINLKNYIDGTKIQGAFMHFLGNLGEK